MGASIARRARRERGPRASGAAGMAAASAQTYVSCARVCLLADVYVSSRVFLKAKQAERAGPFYSEATKGRELEEKNGETELGALRLGGVPVGVRRFPQARVEEAPRSPEDEAREDRKEREPGRRGLGARRHGSDRCEARERETAQRANE